MLQRYRLYRSYGHGRFVAASLAPHTEGVLIAAAALGVVLGVVL